MVLCVTSQVTVLDAQGSGRDDSSLLAEIIEFVVLHMRYLIEISQRKRG